MTNITHIKKKNGNVVNMSSFSVNFT